jgi:succinate dehydrogenase/fumarate reductase flavoprotein subunit
MRTCHTLIIGSGAAGLNAAVQLRRLGVEDILIVTEGLDQGTSINTGSDKQTYYKLALCASASDSPRELADTFFAGGSMHGDLALSEAANSARAFLSLVNLGVPFPRDRYGQFVGYKTDHDPRQRATSVGPYTSRDMCRALIAEVGRLGIPILEHRNVVSLLTIPGTDPAHPLRAAGAVMMDDAGRTEAILAENTVFAVGGPGGLYQTSVYPTCHTGGIGLAIEAGVRAQSLPESQYGLASIQFRWNVSGTYMQVAPKFVSTAADGVSDPREFLLPWFDDPADAYSRVFLKGYQWPFDTQKVVGGSSLIDILVYIETVGRGRRVFLDFRGNPSGFDLARLSVEARTYLEKSRATSGTPLDRLRTMNPGAIQLYLDHGIDLTTEPLEVAVCAQHNNGGLAADAWWESLNVRGLFPVGEVNGSHGVCRPGGSALNSGQVGALRAAEQIAATRREPTLDIAAAQAAAKARMAELEAWLDGASDASASWLDERQQLQARMSRAGAHIRAVAAVRAARDEARAQVSRLQTAGCRHTGGATRAEALRTRSLAIAQLAYLDAIAFQLASGVGSRGSALVQEPAGTRIHPSLPAEWAFVPENPAFREQVLETLPSRDGSFAHRWVPRRPIPETDTWFETAWAAFRNGEIYR